jgi:two-component system chemotaxis response regulator CheY
MPKTVLIVDDVAYVRKTLADIFKEARYQVVGEAESAAQAMELYVKNRPDLVTMDIVMSEMSGIEATRQLLKIDKDARVIMVSGLGQEHLVMDAIHVGARDYITKPFRAADIIRTADRTLSEFGPGTSTPSRNQKVAEG